MDGIIPADWGGAFASGFGFASAFLVFKAVWSAIQWIATFKTAREDRREAYIDAGTQQLLAGLREEVDRLSGECTTLRSRVTATENDLHASREQHAECRKEVMELRGLIQGRGDARNDAARIVAADRVTDKRKEARPDG